jgi:hypothetical protein
VVIQFDDAFYRSNPGRSDQFATGQLIHHVNVVTEKCSALASFDLLAGNDALVVVNADGTVTVNPPGAVDEAYRGSALKISRPFDCPAPAASLEILLRNGLLLVGVASAVLGPGPGSPASIRRPTRNDGCWCRAPGTQRGLDGSASATTPPGGPRGWCGGGQLRRRSGRCLAWHGTRGQLLRHPFTPSNVPWGGLSRRPTATASGGSCGLRKGPRYRRR